MELQVLHKYLSTSTIHTARILSFPIFHRGQTLKFIFRGQSRGTASLQSRWSALADYHYVCIYKTHFFPIMLVLISRCVFYMILKYRTVYFKSKLFKSKEIAHKRRQYIHYVVYYVMVKLLTYSPHSQVTSYLYIWFGNQNPNLFYLRTNNATKWQIHQSTVDSHVHFTMAVALRKIAGLRGLWKIRAVWTVPRNICDMIYHWYCYFLIDWFELMFWWCACITDYSQCTPVEWQWLLSYATALKTSHCLMHAKDFPQAFKHTDIHNDAIPEKVFVSIRLRMSCCCFQYTQDII